MAFDAETRALFQEEVAENLAELDGALLELEKNPRDHDLIDRIFRAVHTLKGACDMFGLGQVVALAHDLESLFDHVRGGWRRVSKELLDAAFAAKYRFAAMLAEGANPVAVIVATGSETSLAMEAHAALAAEGIATRVVSMPCTNVFDRQREAYQEQVLPLTLPTVAIEAAHPDFWRKYVGRTGVVVGIASFGESAPAKDLYPHFGITAQRVVDAARTLVHRAAHRREIWTNSDERQSGPPSGHIVPSNN